ncbi:MAG TPA: catalase HPII, partial [Dietzia sp.]|nr:catalase HPII [Dietzia sp.]
MSTKKSAASKTADVVPGVPGSAPPSVDEPTDPTGPPPPKADQKGATPFSPTGAESADPEDAARQQGRILTTAQGARIS